MFVHPIPDPASVYDKDYFEGAKNGFGYVDYDGDKEPMIPTFNEYLRRIEKALKGKGRFLDVGAATGFFVELARKAGYDAHGVEISDHAAGVGRAKGIDVKTGLITDIEGTYDCITMCDVIEHVQNPRDDIQKAAALLRSGGVLLINTPDRGSLLARVLGLKWHHVGPPEHLYYFNRKNMARLLEEQGFTVLEATTIGKSFTLKYIFKILYKWTKFSPFDWCASFAARAMPRLGVPLNLFDNMFVLAKKK